MFLGLGMMPLLLRARLRYWALGSNGAVWLEMLVHSEKFELGGH